MILIRSLQEWEDRQTAENLELEFQQRVIAASYGPSDPHLYQKLFEPDEVAPEFMPGEDRIMQPTSTEEFLEMVESWDEEGAFEALRAMQMTDMMGDELIPDPFGDAFPENIPEP